MARGLLRAAGRYDPGALRSGRHGGPPPPGRRAKVLRARVRKVAHEPGRRRAHLGARALRGVKVAAAASTRRASAGARFVLCGLTLAAMHAATRQQRAAQLALLTVVAAACLLLLRQWARLPPPEDTQAVAQLQAELRRAPEDTQAELRRARADLADAQRERKFAVDLVEDLQHHVAACMSALELDKDDPEPPAAACADPYRAKYLELLRGALTGHVFATTERQVSYYDTAQDLQRKLGALARMVPEERATGGDWPLTGVTMVGLARLQNIQDLLVQTYEDGVDGDFIECGTWRGGASIFARKVIESLPGDERHVWVADSFAGLPLPRTPASKDSKHWAEFSYLRVSLEDVQTNFRSFGALDERVHFCKGFFVDALPSCGVGEISVLRMDGDMYESSLDTLFNLYERVSVGGFIVVDDWACVADARRAVKDFYAWHDLELNVTVIDRCGGFMQKTRGAKVKQQLYQKFLGKRGGS